jgi:hypothetical protein
MGRKNLIKTINYSFIHTGLILSTTKKEYVMKTNKLSPELFFWLLLVFVVLGTLLTLEKLVRINMLAPFSTLDWFMFFGAGLLGYITAFAAGLEGNEETATKQKLGLILKRLLGRLAGIGPQGDSTKFRLTEELVETMLHDPESYQHYLEELDPQPKEMIFEWCVKAIFNKQKEFANDFLKLNEGYEVGIHVFESSAFHRRGREIAALELLKSYTGRSNS